MREAVFVLSMSVTIASISLGIAIGWPLSRIASVMEERAHNEHK
jgi:hypothetical protein